MRARWKELESEYVQFKRLLKGNCYRFLDNELVAPEGDMSQTAVSILALLAAFNASLTVVLVYKYLPSFERLLPKQLDSIVWPDQEFVISTAMLVTAFTTVITWEGLFPDRRDAMILCPLSIRMRTMFAAKVVSLALLLVIFVTASNAFSFFTFPFFIATKQTALLGLARYAAVHAIVVFAASGFIFLSLLSLKGILINVLSYRTFQRIASYVQLGILFLFLLGFFLMPKIATPPALSDAANEIYIRTIPSFWFVGLYQYLLGSPYPIAGRLAGYAMWGMLISFVLAAVTYTIGYRNQVRKAVEESDAVAGASGGRRSILAGWVHRCLIRSPVEWAVFRFVARTMTRNRKQRLLLAVYLSVGLAYVLADVATAVRSGGQLHRPSPALVSVPLVLTFFILLGMRVLFTIPVELRANWIFQITESGSLSDYRRAVRKVMLLAGALPVSVLTFPAYCVLWGWRTAILHMLSLLLVSLLLVEILMRDFRKIPFTCSFLPGSANLKMKFGIYCVWFVTVSFLVIQLQLQMLRAPGFYLVVFALGCIWLAWLVRRRWQFEREQRSFVYEEKPEWLRGTLSLQS